MTHNQRFKTTALVILYQGQPGIRIPLPWSEFSCVLYFESNVLAHICLYFIQVFSGFAICSSKSRIPLILKKMFKMGWLSSILWICMELHNKPHYDCMILPGDEGSFEILWWAPCAVCHSDWWFMSWLCWWAHQINDQATIINLTFRTSTCSLTSCTISASPLCLWNPPSSKQDRGVAIAKTSFSSCKLVKLLLWPHN